MSKLEDTNKVDATAAAELTQSLLDKVQTFDLIGFRGCGVLSKTVSHFQRRMLRKSVRKDDPSITHVAIAVRGADLLKLPSTKLGQFVGVLESDQVYIFESTNVPKSMDKVPDVFGRHPRGVKVRSLPRLLESFGGHVFWSSHLFESNSSMLEGLALFMNEKNHMAYERSIQVLLANVMRCGSIDSSSAAKTESLFCSELVARLLIDLSVLPQSVNPEMAMPLDFYQHPRDSTRTYDIDNQIPVLFSHPQYSSSNKF